MIPGVWVAKALVHTLALLWTHLEFIVFVHSLLSHRTRASITIKCQPGMGKFSEALKGNSAGSEPSLNSKHFYCVAQATFLLKL